MRKIRDERAKRKAHSTHRPVTSFSRLEVETGISASNLKHIHCGESKTPGRELVIALAVGLGRAIRHHVLVQRHLPAERRADKVVFVVMTDGYENASLEFDARRLRDIIRTERDKWGWEFIFLGAGIDAIQAAADIGISADRAVNFVADDVGIAASFDGVSQAVGNLRARRRLEDNADGTSWRERMDRDYRGRAR